MSVQRFGLSLAALTLLGFAPALARQQPVPWYAQPMFGTGGYPSDFALADFDRDGRLDVALTGGSTSSQYSRLSLLRGTQAGYFGPANTLDAGIEPALLESVDVNHDGAPDLIVSGHVQGSSYLGRLSVLLARGAGRFRAPIVTVLDVQGGVFVLGDVDEDGEIDVVLDGGSRLLLGHGDGSFDPALALPFSGWRGIELVDVDGDHHLDLGGITTTALNTAHGHGDGTFDAAVTAPIESYPAGVVFHDFDGDGNCEALTTRGTAVVYGDDAISLEVRAGLGGGAFGLPAVLWSGPFATTPVLADVDADGRVDIGMPHGIQYGGPDPSGVAWIRSLGSLAFAPAVEIRNGGGTLSALWGDLEGDGDVDLVTINDFAKTEIGVVHALRPGVFETGPKLLDTVGQPAAVAVGDLDGDGWIDIAAAVSDLPQVELWRGTGSGNFAAQPPLIGGVPFRNIAIADFNQDGRADVAAAGAVDWYHAGELWTWRSMASGYAATKVLDLEVGVFGLAAADLDGDGRADLAVSSHALVRVLHSRTDGTFELVSTITMSGGLTNGGDLFVGDYDGDGRNDIAQIPHEEWVWVAYGTGGGHFGTPVSTPIDEHIQLLAAGDLDLDGRDDLIVEELDSNPGTLYALWGRTDRTFDVQQFISMYWVFGAVIADFNGNGCPDVGAFDGGSMQVLTTDCDRGFDPPRGFGLAQEPRTPVAADLDRDGRIDVVTALAMERRIAVLLHH